MLSSEVRVELAAGVLGNVLGAQTTDDAAITLAVPIRPTRTGSVVRLVQPDRRSAAGTIADVPMIKLLARSRALWKRLEQGDADITTLAREMGPNDSYVTRVVRLAFLAPSIVEKILAGDQAAKRNAATLLGARLLYAGKSRLICWHLRLNGSAPARAVISKTPLRPDPVFIHAVPSREAHYRR